MKMLISSSDNENENQRTKESASVLYSKRLVTRWIHAILCSKIAGLSTNIAPTDTYWEQIALCRDSKPNWLQAKEKTSPQLFSTLQDHC
jgi:hypothetical protein